MTVLIAVLCFTGVPNAQYKYKIHKDSVKTRNKSHATSSAASVGEWRNDFTVPGVIKGVVYTMTSDGTNLYLGGDFSVAGSKVAYNIVKWDGSNWISIGNGAENGVNGPVYGLSYINNKLIAGGSFSKAGSLEVNGLAFWDGLSWQRLGQDSLNGVRNRQITFSGDTIITAGQVYSMTRYGDYVVFGGYFNIVGSDTSQGIGGWNTLTGSWENFNRGLSNQYEEDPAYAYAMIQKGNELYVGGKFSKAGATAARGFARWNGSQWSEVGGGVNDWIRDLALDSQGNIIAAGYFDSAGTVAANGIAKWDGVNWQSKGGGISPYPGSEKPDVRAIEIVNNEIYVTGAFLTAGSSKVASVAKWNGTAWSTLGTGVFNNSTGYAGTGTSLQVVNNKLYIGGYITRADEQLFSNVASRDLNAGYYSKLSDGSPEHGIFDGYLFSASQSAGKIFAGGAFSIIGGAKAKNIAVFKDGQWSSLGEGIDGEIYTVLADGDSVYAGGSFGLAGTDTAYHIARWNGDKWSSVGIGVGGVPNASVNVIRKKGNYLYVGGNFSVAGDSVTNELPVNSIARFNLVTNRWEALGSGLEMFPGTPGLVYDIEIAGDSICVGGYFTAAGTLPVNSVAVYVNGEWYPVGASGDNGVTGVVYTLQKTEEGLLIGGEFERPGTGNTTSFVRWNGNSWAEIGGGLLYENTLGQIPRVSDIAYSDGKLYVCGLFTKAGTTDASNIAVYSQGLWDNLAGGIDDFPIDLDLTGNSLIASGTFTIAGNHPSVAIAAWDITTAIEENETLTVNRGYNLAQNYPNPFNPVTVISFKLPVQADAKIRIYNIMGQQVTELLNENLKAGTHTVKWNAAEYSSGVYFYELTAGDLKISKKMLLVK